MKDKNVARLIQDFCNWSGGFPPESIEQVTVYLTYSVPIDVGVSDEEARQVLIELVNSNESVI